MKRKVVGAMLAFLLIFQLPVMGWAVESKGEIRAGSNSVKAGETAEIPVKISGNTGIAGLLVEVSYNQDVFTYDGCKAGLLADSGTVLDVPSAGSVKVMWYDVRNLKKDGTLFTLKFKTSASASGTYSIRLSVSAANTVDQSGKRVSFTAKDGSITVKGSGGTATPSPSAEGPFPDVSSRHWANESISYLKKKGVVSGSTDGLFHPDNKVTRAEFVKMLCGVAGGTPGGSHPFADVDSKKWYSKYVAWGYRSKVISGVSAKKFAPEEPVTREQICVMLVRLADKKGVALPKTVPAKQFTDSVKISRFAKDAVNAAQRAGLLNGYSDGSAGPQNNATRAEAAQLLYKFAKILNK